MSDSAVERTVDLPAPPDEVWRALTDDAQLEAWFADEAELDVRPGGEGRFVEDGLARRALVDDVEPGRRLAFRWWPEDGGPVTRVEVELAPCVSGTRLVVVESPVPLFPVARLEARCSALVLA